MFYLIKIYLEISDSTLIFRRHKIFAKLYTQNM